MDKMTNHQRKELLNKLLKRNFSILQKEQLILGEKEGIDFWEYANPEISFMQMEEMRNSMKNT